jgi:hypothetical protein
MDADRAAGDLDVIRRVLEATHRRVDPHMFHFVLWGAVVLLWYPLSNWFEMQGNGLAQFVLAIVALVLGNLGSTIGEWREHRSPRLKAGDTRLAKQLGLLVWIFLGAAGVLSAALPLAGAGKYVPHAWGFAYAMMSMTLGIVYSVEFFWSGLAIFAGAVVALFFLPYWGFILGAAMGLGILVPGLIAERRVRRLREELPNVEL